ncbi:MAG: DUF1788 domain-containing protein [Candidatus Aminicenantes bacterium]|jgi:hypothetical protein
MSLLGKNIKTLENDLISDPVRISAYHDLPFAIFLYDPREEYICRKRIRLLGISLEQNHKKKVTFVSLGKLLWKIIHETEGIDALIAEEKQYGFDRLQKTINQLMSDEDFMPLPNLLEDRIKGLDPAKDIVFLVRIGALAPSIFRASLLLDKMHGRTMVPIILFYPGSSDGHTDLKFMNMQDRSQVGMYNYRVKIYGGST